MKFTKLIDKKIIKISIYHEKELQINFVVRNFKTTLKIIGFSI